jgi:hypothetical protein
MKRLNNKLSYALYILLAVVFFSSCTPLDSSLDGKVLTDKYGNVYRLEWQDGWGATWAFKYPVERIVKGDTIVVWEYYR